LFLSAVAWRSSSLLLMGLLVFQDQAGLLCLRASAVLMCACSFSPDRRTGPTVASLIFRAVILALWWVWLGLGWRCRRFGAPCSTRGTPRGDECSTPATVALAEHLRPRRCDVFGPTGAPLHEQKEMFGKEAYQGLTIV